jgi:hypothetical protein
VAEKTRGAVGNAGILERVISMKPILTLLTLLTALLLAQLAF